jgi:hypothetical protein
VRFDEPDRLVPVPPDIRPGRMLGRWDFGQVPPPGWSTRSARISETTWFEAQPGGVLVTMWEPRTLAFADYGLRLRDGCVRTTFTVYDPGARIGVVARRSAIDEMRVGYSFNAAVDDGSAWVNALFEANTHLAQRPIGTTQNALARGAGRMVLVELRVQGPSLQAWVDQRLVLAVHDPTYGVGGFGVRIGRDQPRGQRPTRILMHGYDVHGVMA